MKSMSKMAALVVFAVSAVVAWPAASRAADEAREDAEAGVCIAARAEVQPRQQADASEPSKAASASALTGDQYPYGGYCTLDCSPCYQDSDCYGRLAGLCTAIQACFRQGPGF
ncbi:hypothetical protein HMI49_39005 [Corallococcus exercitus]|uniref:Uncharacterized protein n=1 Tax=Corallococcus exercitus TaxID=2316736 RepID=A0A7Y4KSJ1_9BACT|nr:hypothetical protein [Corallococcus exercitus]NOK39182.1 hypothetical protein [Corallococcus exercitus]